MNVVQDASAYTNVREQQYCGLETESYSRKVFGLGP